MATTTAELTRIAEALNTVQSAAQVRAAIGAALNALHAAYDVAGRIDNDQVRRNVTNELTIARQALELWFSKIVPRGGEDYRNEWYGNRNLVDRAYVVIAGAEGAAEWVPRTSNWEILWTSIKEAPKVFAQAAGDVAGTAAGSVAGGLLGGLGLSGIFWVAIAGLVVLAIVKRGTILGKIGGLVSG
jgi:hypothetical protein